MLSPELGGGLAPRLYLVGRGPHFGCPRRPVGRFSGPDSYGTERVGGDGLHKRKPRKVFNAAVIGSIGSGEHFSAGQKVGAPSTE